MANFVIQAAVPLRPEPTPSALSISDAAPVSERTGTRLATGADRLPLLLQKRKARAALAQARDGFERARRHAHAHPEDEAAWTALRGALAVLERAASALALL